LQWKTASEKNVANFEIQRSLDGNRFETFQKQAPKSELGSSYEVFDAKAFQFANNEVFYRLKSIDFDGSLDFSNIERLAQKEIDLPFAISPNPVKDKFFVRIKNLDFAKTEIKISDTQGRVLPTTIAPDGSVDISRFASGLYHITIKKDDFISKGLIIKE